MSPTLQSILIAAVGACGVLSSCGGSSKQTGDDRGGGGDVGATSGTGTGGSGVGGSGVGGGSTGGNSTGGDATGGNATGGNATGGGATGGDATGGKGGAAMGGGAGTSAGAGPGGGGGKGGVGGAGGTGGTAVNGGAGGTGGTAGSGGARPGPHCDGVPPICGPMGASNCCASSVVPGGTFNRSNDAAAPATVSEFRLDTYEATVGRYRRFIASYPNNLPASGSGKNPNNANDPGWDPAWNTTGLDRVLMRPASCPNRTWTEQAGANEARPMNCIHWLEAQAFCIWDEGRLPTEAEWNYAAAGGAEQRVYPWSNPPASETIDTTYADYGQNQGTPFPVVGSRSPKGDARWGHADMAGSLFEMAHDYWGMAYPMPCVDCTNLVPDATTAYRINRGGGHIYAASQARTTYRDRTGAASDNVGFRCARRP